MPPTTRTTTRPRRRRRWRSSRRRRRGRRGPDRHARVQRLDPGRAQERARLGLPAGGDEPAAEQARGRRIHGRLRGRLGAGRAAQGLRHRRPRWPRSPAAARPSASTTAAAWSTRKSASSRTQSPISWLPCAPVRSRRSLSPPRASKATDRGSRIPACRSIRSGFSFAWRSRSAGRCSGLRRRADCEAARGPRSRL